MRGWTIAEITGTKKSLEVVGRAANVRSLRKMLGNIRKQNERERTGKQFPAPEPTRALPAPTAIERTASREIQAEGLMKGTRTVEEQERKSRGTTSTKEEDSTPKKSGLERKSTGNESSLPTAREPEKENAGAKSAREKVSVLEREPERKNLEVAVESFSLERVLEALSLNGSGNDAILAEAVRRVKSETGAFDLLAGTHESEAKALEHVFGLNTEKKTVPEACDALSNEGERATPKELVEKGLQVLREALVFDALTCDDSINGSLERRREALQVMRARGAMQKLRKTDALAFEVLARRYLGAGEVLSLQQVAKQLHEESVTKRLAGTQYVRIIEKRGVDELLDST
ncbi:hypothetical protein HY992_04380 [Candidatus Micrarchaeota archaeon]|nr:hypothetical protein [Candidatus Micrarchaeota archaeon]